MRVKIDPTSLSLLQRERPRRKHRKRDIRR